MLLLGQLDKQTKTSNKIKIKIISVGYPESYKLKGKYKMSPRSETFNIPEMSNYDLKKDFETYRARKALLEEIGVDGMDFEPMKGEETYVSPEEASPEALKRIKARKIGGFINVILGNIS